MRKSVKIIMAGALVLGMALTAMSCQKGPAERAGEKIDNGVQNVKDAARDAKDDVTKK
jgi:hypothetical protein